MGVSTLLMVNPFMIFMGTCDAQRDFTGTTPVTSLPTYTFGAVGVPTVPASARTVSTLALTCFVKFSPLQFIARAF